LETNDLLFLQLCPSRDGRGVSELGLYLLFLYDYFYFYLITKYKTDNLVHLFRKGVMIDIDQVQKHPTQSNTDRVAKIAENLRLHPSPKEIQMMDLIQFRPSSVKKRKPSVKKRKVTTKKTTKKRSKTYIKADSGIGLKHIKIKDISVIELTRKLYALPDREWLPEKIKNIKSENIIKLNGSLINYKDDIYYLAYRVHLYIYNDYNEMQKKSLSSSGYKLPIMWDKKQTALSEINQKKLNWGDSISFIGFAVLKIFNTNNINNNFKIDVIKDTIFKEVGVDPRLYRKADDEIYISYLIKITEKNGIDVIRLYEIKLADFLNNVKTGIVLNNVCDFSLNREEKGWTHWTYNNRDFLIYQLFDPYPEVQKSILPVSLCQNKCQNKCNNSIVHFEYNNKTCKVYKSPSNASSFFEYFNNLVTFTGGSPAVPILYKKQQLFVAIGHNKIKAANILTDLEKNKNSNKYTIINNQLLSALKEYKKRLYKHNDIYMMFIYMFNPETGEITHISNSFYPPTKHDPIPFSLVYTSGLCRTKSHYLISYGEGDVIVNICNISDRFAEKEIGIHKIKNLVHHPQDYEFKFF
jgi:hypothetical protein